MSRILMMIYGLVCYALGVVSLVLFILFANNHIGMVLPEYAALGIDYANTAPWAMPMAANIALIVLFGLQHTIMARPAFKSRLTAFLPQAMERSTYILMTALVLIILVLYWQPMTGMVWHVENETARLALQGIYFLGWVITFAATYMINHFHLFGLQQTFHWGNPDSTVKKFVTPMFYKLVRHPIQTGVVIAMIGTPDMTVGRATLAVGMIVYIAIGLHYEERDLIAEFGDTYRDYMKRVGRVFPKFLRR